jgi:hypothetical protein
MSSQVVRYEQYRGAELALVQADQVEDLSLD